MSSGEEKPTLDEAVAVMAAVEAFGKKLRPRVRRKVSDLPTLLEELRAAIVKMQAVTH